MINLPAAFRQLLLLLLGLLLSAAVLLSIKTISIISPTETTTTTTPPAPATTTNMASIRRIAPLLIPAVSPARHTATVIFIHGLGDSGHGWSSAVEHWRRYASASSSSPGSSPLDEVKFILPHAPNIPITCNGGMRMPGWYDIAALTGRVEDLRSNQDEAGTLVSRDYVRALVQAEMDAGIPADRIVVGGFSQGGAVALFSGLTAPWKLGGVIGLSSYVPLDHKLAGILVDEHDRNRDTPVLMCHGGADMVVPTALGKLSSELLGKLGFPVTWKEYPGMGHNACDEELDEVAAFLSKQLPPKGKSEL